MGYYAHSNGADILILKKDHGAIMQQAKQKWPDKKCCDDIDSQFHEFDLTVDFDHLGNINDMYFEYEKYHTEDIEAIFNLISPYVQEGSYITFTGEDDALWAYYFDGIDVKEYSGEVTFPGMPIGGPKKVHSSGG